MAAYGQSKLANLMFAYDLQRRLATAKAKTVAVAAHPGVAATELIRHVPGAAIPGVRWLTGRILNTAEMGALPTLRAATDPAVRGGQYWGPDGFREMRGHPVLVRSSTQSTRRRRPAAALAGLRGADRRHLSDLMPGPRPGTCPGRRPGICAASRSTSG